MSTVYGVSAKQLIQINPIGQSLDLHFKGHYPNVRDLFILNNIYYKTLIPFYSKASDMVLFSTKDGIDLFSAIELATNHIGEEMTLHYQELEDELALFKKPKKAKSLNKSYENFKKELEELLDYLKAQPHLNSIIEPDAD